MCYNKDIYASADSIPPQKSRGMLLKTETECYVMSKKKTTKKPQQPPRRREDSGKRAFDIILSLMLAGGVGYFVYDAIRQSGPIDQTTTYSSQQSTEESTEPETVGEDKVIFTNQEFQNTDVHTGSLILVNNSTEFQDDDSDVVSLYEVKLAADCHSFSVRDGELMVRQECADALVTFFDAFYLETFDDNIVVQSGHRSRERQQELYDADLEANGTTTSTLVAKPGFSEHQTGLSVDLSLVGGEDYDGTGIYEWLNEHCHEFGFVLRYPENKTAITEIQYEPWHYRYVGAPHASYMMQNGLCLEEYMVALKDYTYEGEHLMITNHDGKRYEVYYVPVDPSFDTTMVPVPTALDYTVQGNNTDGFIVSIDTGLTAELTESAPDPTEAQTDAPTGDESAEIAE